MLLLWEYNYVIIMEVKPKPKPKLNIKTIWNVDACNVRPSIAWSGLICRCIFVMFIKYIISESILNDKSFMSSGKIGKRKFLCICVFVAISRWPFRNIESQLLKNHLSKNKNRKKENKKTRMRQTTVFVIQSAIICPSSIWG